jgi:hypothetical protein
LKHLPNLHVYKAASSHVFSHATFDVFVGPYLSLPCFPPWSHLGQGRPHRKLNDGPPHT